MYKLAEKYKTMVDEVNQDILMVIELVRGYAARNNIVERERLITPLYEQQEKLELHFRMLNTVEDQVILLQLLVYIQNTLNHVDIVVNRLLKKVSHKMPIGLTNCSRFSKWSDKLGYHVFILRQGDVSPDELNQQLDFEFTIDEILAYIIDTHIEEPKDESEVKFNEFIELLVRNVHSITKRKLHNDFDTMVIESAISLVITNKMVEMMNMFSDDKKEVITNIDKMILKLDTVINLMGIESKVGEK